ncbi:MAG TPA: HPr family phosphocarrier protein, partial [Pseudoclavibacter sp.]|nr:HPr family phosphocarrier protein [Pseudoclavibacter sp.]
ALAAATARYDAQVQVADVTRGSGPVRADSSIMLMSLGATHGDVLEVSASGRDAHAAVAEIIDLIESGFGEE